MYTVGKLSKMFNLSRSTLLYYDRMNLLKPSARSESNYRLYTEEDVERLRSIVQHREAGISLDDISKLFDIQENDVTVILSNRLKDIQLEVQTLKKQESMILAVLMDKVTKNVQKTFNKDTWSKLLIDSGYTHEDLRKWHKEFELATPEKHRAFLIALGMSSDEISELIKIINE